MKRLACIFIAAALLFGASSCAPKGVDVFAEALSLTDFGASLEGMPFMALGTGIFHDSDKGGYVSFWKEAREKSGI